MLGDSLRRRNAPTPPRPGTKPARPPRAGRLGGLPGWARWILAALVILLGSFITGYLLSTQVLFEAPETAGTGVPVPDLYGIDREGAEAALADVGLGVGQVSLMPSSRIPAGQVLAQGPVAGQQLRPGATVDLTLSGGPPEVRVPPVEGLAQRAARDILEEAGFAVQIAQIPSPAVEGTVARTDPVPGRATTLPATVTVFVSLGPPMVDTALPPAGPGGD